jgi:CRISPR-associated protein Csb1
MSRSRILIDLPLQSAIGTRFQPTGFPDIGAAEFMRPVRREGGDVLWQRALLVESAQSMANRLESVGWDAVANAPEPVLAGLPYLRVVRDGQYVTSSRTESHRLASAFVKDSVLDGTSMVDVIKERLGLRDDTPLTPAQIAGAILELDPLCLVHGVFFADSRWPGQPKIARAITAFVEATEVERADSGGVKKDHVRHSLADATGGTSEGYGTVPFHRTEWTAADIVASFAIDRRQIASYGLGNAASEMLEAIALWEIRALLDAGLRLRTACDLEPIDEEVRDRDGIVLPGADELEARVASGVAACAAQLGTGGAIEVVWNGGGKRGKAA